MVSGEVGDGNMKIIWLPFGCLIYTRSGIIGIGTGAFIIKAVRMMEI